jgi:peptide/nickel transport system substrate-binding protein
LVFNFLRIDRWKSLERKFPPFKNFFYFWNVLSKNERVLLLTFCFFAIISGLAWCQIEKIKTTKIVPATGGVLNEIIIGLPHSLNPLFGENYPVDKAISHLLFSGLLKYDGKGNLIQDLAQSFEVKENGKVYHFILKDNLFWSDGQKITTDDIVFTLETILSPKVQSPLAFTFQDVKIQKINQREIEFILPNPYPFFLENFTFKILPSHIFKENVQEITLPNFYQKTVFSGPFKIKEVIKNKEGEMEKLILDQNPYWYQNPPFLQEIIITFFKDQKEALKNFQGISTLALEHWPLEKDEILPKNINLNSIGLTRYFALFLNQKNEILKRSEVKQALAQAVPKDEIIQKVLLGKGRKVDGIFLPEHQINQDFPKIEFNPELAKKTLEENGWKLNQNGFREKEEGDKKLKLEFSLYLPEQEDLKNTATILQKSWQSIGVKLNITSLPPQKLLQDIVRERKYDILLLGYALNLFPDPFVFWHSSQSEFPGRNLSMYQNDKVDELIKKARETQDLNERKKILGEIQTQIAQDLPAIFLFSPDFLYLSSPKIKGLDLKYLPDPSWRFAQINQWYLKTKRVKK